MPFPVKLATASLVAVSVMISGATLQAETARFIVRDKIVSPAVPPFTATVGWIGNGVNFMRAGGGFEPTIFRTRFMAQQNSANSILADADNLSFWNSWPDGFLDGADIDVMRIVNGKLETVRTDKVAPGGYRVSGWLPALPAGQMLGPEATQVTLSWESWNRLDVPWYFTVRAVDAQGRLSALATPVTVSPPTVPGQAPKPEGLEKLVLAKDGGASTTLAAPQDFSAKLLLSRSLLLNWAPVPGAAGYVVYRSSVAPEQMKGAGIDLVGPGVPIEAGDMIFARKTFMFPSRAEVATGRLWNSERVRSNFGIAQVPGMPGDPDMPKMELVPYGADHPVPEGGRTYLKVDLLPGQKLPLGNYAYSGSAGSYYPVLDPSKTYRFEIWLRAKGAVGATFQLVGPYGQIKNLPAVFRPGPEWKRYSVDFQVPTTYTGKQAGKFQLTLTGSGEVDVDNYRVYRADAPYLGLLPEDRTALADSGMELLRSHMFIKTGTATYDLDALTSPAGVNPRSGGDTLPQFLTICKETGIEPWLQIEPHLTQQEWLGLVEYLAAPFDPAKDDPKALPWAARRVAEGHPAPWTDDFQKIYFELGNETWNMMFTPWTFPPMQDAAPGNKTKYSPGAVYGIFQEHVLDMMRKSPWWDRIAPKLTPVLGGWLIAPYGFDALQYSPSSKAVTVADYIGGWDSGEGPVQQKPEGYASVMAFAPQMTTRYATQSHRRLAAMGLEGRVALGTYEEGPGYALNGLNGRSVTDEQRSGQEKVMKSAAAGAATLDVFLTRALAGDTLQSFFTFSRGTEWTSHAHWYNGGQSYPSWDWLTLFNHVGTGDMLAVDAKSVPRQDVPQMDRRPAMSGVPMAAAYAARQGDRLTVTVISREVPDVPPGNDGKMSVEVDLPISGAKSLTRYSQSGDYKAQNTASQQTSLVSQKIPVPDDPAKLEIPDMPPASALVYVFEGVTFDK